MWGTEKIYTYIKGVFTRWKNAEFKAMCPEITYKGEKRMGYRDNENQREREKIAL